MNAMTPEHYLDSKKEDILSNLTAGRELLGNSYTPEKANEVFQKIYYFVGLLKAVRLAESSTKEILQTLNSYPDLDCRAIKHWLLESIKYDDSFCYSYNSLAIECNRDLGIPAIQLKGISFDCLTELVKKESTSRSTKEHIIPIDKDMEGIFEISSNHFECEYPMFRRLIERADYREVTHKINYAQFLTHKLSVIMGDEWYGAVCANMNWKKTICGGKSKYNNFEVGIRLNDFLTQIEKRSKKK